MEVRQRGVVFWGKLIMLYGLNGGVRTTELAVLCVKPNGRNPEVGKAIRGVGFKEIRKLSLLELIAEAADEEEDDGQAAGS